LTIVTPTYKEQGFTCPICSVYAKMDWKFLDILYNDFRLETASCQHCKYESIWRVKYTQGGAPIKATMVYPDNQVTVLPNPDMMCADKNVGFNLVN